MGGTGDKIKGKANETVGKMTDDTSKEMKGKAQQGKGEMKDQVSDAKTRMRDDDQE
jgi:uncharacterized protein YjbJ (UPF0337 family)